MYLPVPGMFVTVPYMGEDIFGVVRLTARTWLAKSIQAVPVMAAMLKAQNPCRVLTL